MRFRGPWSAIVLGVSIALPSAAVNATRAHGAEPVEGEVDSIDRDYSTDLPRFAPVGPYEALDMFEVEPGFKVELAAREPLVTDPVAIDFDEHGRAYVVEMIGYSEDADDMLGRVRVLEDSDRDGQFDTSTVFVDDLAWPTAVLCYDGGVFVGAAPDIHYFKDADGDGIAEIRRVVFTGFGLDNVQGLLNSFRWGLDNRIHVATSRCGADLRRGDQPDAEPLVLRGRNFSFDPRTLDIEATSGASQHGLTFDPEGNAFTCHNSDHIQQIVMDDKYLSRNPLMRPPAALASIAVEGPAADVFRISPVEPWREIRTRLRAKGIVPGLVEGGGRAAGFFTSATGVTIYTGDAWPEEFHGNAFIGDVGSNLIHRKIVERNPSAIPLVAKRDATENREFVASRDTWFRPVQFANAPDGNLYVLDMYREVIEHPASLPPIIKKHLDLTSGRDRGRIYRIVRADASANDLKKQRTRELPGDATTKELVAMLAHPNGWHRTSAARLLFERNDAAAAPELLALFRSDAPAPSRLLALHSLASLNHLDLATLEGALADPDPRIREQAVRLAASRLSAPTREGEAPAEPRAAEKLEPALLALANDLDLHVRYQTAFALGETQNPARIDALASIIRRDVGEQYVSAAVFSAVGHDGELLLHALLDAPDFDNTTAGTSFLRELCRQIGARGDDRELASAAADFAAVNSADPDMAGNLIVALLNGAGPKRFAVRKQLVAHADGAAETIITDFLKRSSELAADEEADPKLRTAAIAALPLAGLAEAAPLLVELMAPRQPQGVQSAALATLAQFGDADVAPTILDAWPGMGPALRLQAANLLLSRGASALAMLNAVESGALSPRDLDPATIQQLKTHAESAVRDKAANLLDVSAPKRTEVVEAHIDVRKLTGDLERGRDVFRKHCAICHRKDGYGTDVGADLATVLTRTPEALLIAVLDPNREVDPRYIQYNILTVDGLAKAGMIAGETATSVTLKRAENITETVPRADIEALQSTGMTLMPEGFEKVIDKQSLADLVEYLRNGT